MSEWKQDVRYGFRMLAKMPGLTAIVILSLALGIGANTAVFSLINSILLRPLAFHDPDKLMIIWEDASFVGFPQNTPAPANYADWKSQNTVFSSMAALATADFDLTGVGEPVRLAAYSVTADFFPVLGVHAAKGRFFLPEEDKPGANSVVVISYGLWQRQFGGDPNIINRELLLNNERYTVIGVAPARFQFLDPEINLWVPIKFTAERLQNRNAHYLQVVGRLKNGVTLQEARAEMSSIMKRIAKDHPDSAGPLGISVIPLREQIVGNIKGQLILLLMAVAFVLLIACGNVANLLLSAATTRSKEIALRAALGAGKLRLIRQQMTESLILSIAGGMLGLLLAIASFAFLKQLIPLELTVSTKLSIDSRVLLFNGIISVLTGLFFGLAPSAQAFKTDLNEVLKAGGARSGGVGGRSFRNVMVVAEIALALVLLVGAALIIQSIVKLQKLDLGFAPDHVLRIETLLPKAVYDTHQKRMQFYDRVLERVEALPSVQSAGYSTAVPLDWKGGTNGYEWEGRPTKPSEVLDANHREVSQRLLQTLGIPIVEGRYFDGTENLTSMRSVIVNEAMAQTYGLPGSVVGKRLHFGPDEEWFTVIGVVKNIRNMGLEAEPKPEMYYPMHQADFGFTFYAPKELLIRTKGEPLNIVPDVRKIIRSIDPNLPISHVMDLNFIVTREFEHRRITMVLLAAFAALALLLASIGIYGVLSYFVNQQIPEIGVRLALGARPKAILLLIIQRGMMLAVIGVAIGVIVGFALTRIMQSLLYQVSAKDPSTYFIVAGILMLASLAACLFPGRRAMRIDPIAALRYE